jgi:hypothetical protein
MQQPSPCSAQAPAPSTRKAVGGEPAREAAVWHALAGSQLGQPLRARETTKSRPGKRGGLSTQCQAVRKSSRVIFFSISVAMRRGPAGWPAQPCASAVCLGCRSPRQALMASSWSQGVPRLPRLAQTSPFGRRKGPSSQAQLQEALPRQASKTSPQDTAEYQECEKGNSRHPLALAHPRETIYPQKTPPSPRRNTPQPKIELQTVP